MTVHGLFRVPWCKIGAMNDALMCVRSEMAVKFGFTK